MIDKEYIKITKEVKDKMPELENYSLIEVYYFWECFSNLQDAQFLTSNALSTAEDKSEFRSLIVRILNEFNEGGY